MATRTQAKRTLAAFEKEAAERAKAKRAKATAKAIGKGVKKPGGRAVDQKKAVAAARAALAAERSVKIRELDPYAKCGPDTSVMELYRVDEAVNGAKHVHLVFFDRHGWYCLHGRACPAVNDVRRMDRAHAVRTH